MLNNNFTTKLVGLQEIIIKNMETTEEKIEITIEMPVKTHICPQCKNVTNRIHDYRIQKIKDTPAFGKKVVLIFKKRRYVCKECCKRFVEQNTFVSRYQHKSKRFIWYVLDKLKEERSFSSVAREVGLSVSNVIRIFDIVGFKKPEVPRVIGIDEFKGDTNGEKYQCILTDIENGIVLDILPMRSEHYLINYFKDANRTTADYFISDMWKPYAKLATNFFKDATQVIDKYHYVRQAIWAFEGVRKEVQKHLTPQQRKYFKRSKKLLTSRFQYLKDEEKCQVNIMLYTSATLSSAHYLKELFFEVIDQKDPIIAKKLFSEWIACAETSTIPQFEKCAATYRSWFVGITNSFKVPYTNGFTEGCNNKIKVLKRNAYGYRDFSRFRNRILFIFSHQRVKKQEACIHKLPA